MMESKQIPIHKSLSYTQAKYGVLSALILGTVFSIGQIVLDYFSLNNQIGSSVESMVVAANSSAYLSVYNLDRNNAAQVTSGLVSYAPIISASIIDDFGNELGSADGASSADATLLARLLFGESEELTYELIDESIGSGSGLDGDVGVSAAPGASSSGGLIVTVDRTREADVFIQRSVVVLLSGIARNFILALILLYVFHRAITQAIIATSTHLRSGSENKRVPLAENHQEDEFGVLVHALNDRLSTIDQQKQEIMASNEHLEELVQLRTSQLDEANQQLEAEKAVAVQASQGKSDFLAMMSHEMRTPMNGILGMVELLGKRYPSKSGGATAAEEEEREYLEAITDSSNSLVTLMNSVLDYSKYSKGKMEFEYADFDLRRLLNGVVFLLSTTADKRNNTLSLHISTEIPPILHGDAEKLRQVLINLLSNSIKFTEGGAINLSVSLADQNIDSKLDKDAIRVEENNPVCLLFTVEDTGIGIPLEAQPRIFDPFVQATTSIGGRFGGTGLGLGICKQIVEQQQGTINFSSEEEKGTIFSVSLGFQIGEAEEAAQAASNSGKEKRILTVLVVDDLAINQKLARAQLESEGHSVFLASDGSEALEIIEQQAVDVVLMDLYMPVMNGLEATRAMREATNEKIATVPIIGVTANLDTETDKKCMDAGMSAVTAKPLTSEKLYRLFAEVGLQNSIQPLQKDVEPDGGEMIDRAMLEQHRNALGSEKFEEMYAEAHLTAKEYVAQIESAFQNEDYAALESSAHTLAGLCANFGLIKLDSVASKIEEFAMKRDKKCIENLVQEVVLVCAESFRAVQ